jgi:hypothetical protein
MVRKELRPARRSLPLSARLFVKLVFDSYSLGDHDLKGAAQDVQDCLCVSGFGTVARMTPDLVLQ